MSKTAINSVTNANVYIDGTNLLGRAAEVTLPEIKEKMAEHNALGMVGDIMIPAGGLESMECKIKWASVYPEVQRKAYARQGVQLQIRATLRNLAGQGLVDEVPAIVMIGGTFKTNVLGTFKKHESQQPEDTINVYYLKYIVNGEALLEVDVMNNIYKVAGDDLLSRFRQLTGA